MQGAMSSSTAPPTGAGAGEEASTTSHANIREIMASLPMEPGFPPYRLRRYRGYLMSELFLNGVAAAHACFKPRPADVFLASFPKSGTTWLKALAFSALHRGRHPPSDGDHPLRRGSPHDCVGFLEVSPKHVDSNYAASDLYEELPSPRLLATHLPYSLLPRRVTEECRLVYICRDPKDTLVSLWNFHEKSTATLQRLVGSSSSSMPTFEEAFELFCEGRCMAGPQWRHALEFWEASRRSPDKVLFLRYEEMLRDAAGNLEKLAAFMGCAFSEEEVEAGVVRDIVELCSLEKLRNLEVNKNGSTLLGLKNETFFRKGAVGDWSNYMTPEMAARLDKIVGDALQGSMLTFGTSSM